MEALKDYWPMLLTAAAVVAFMIRLESAARDTASWRERHQKAVRDGFDGVNQRLDTLNGKVYSHEGAIAELRGVRRT